MIDSMNNEKAALAAKFANANATLPLVAILRGIVPEEVDAIGETLYASGLRLIEVPLNSPEPFTSIERLRRVLPGDALVGAGTVLNIEQLHQLESCGGQLAVMPNCDVSVISTAKVLGLTCIPGIVTPSEAFAALSAGADALKLFPAELISPAILKALRVVLPEDTHLLPVGGITPTSMQSYIAAGARGFGLGSTLYTPAMTRVEVGARARSFVEAWQRIVER